VEELPVFFRGEAFDDGGSGTRERDMAGQVVALDTKREQLLAMMRGYGSCAVAFSAGVDSTVLAKAAALTLGPRAVAVTGISPSLAESELRQARALAKQIGIPHVEIETNELDQPGYVNNAPDRCYHCKSALYRTIHAIRDQLDVAVIVNGNNADDLDDYRPGSRAAEQQQVASPLAACGLTKDDVRRLARAWKLPIWDKPAAPCLSSRIAYGQRVTPERLAMIERAEQYLRQLGCAIVRVRYHEGDLARLEVPLDDVARLTDPTTRRGLVEYFTKLGFKFVTLDLAGFRSGSLNVFITEQQLKQV